MQFPRTTQGRFVKRLNRFLVQVKIGSKKFSAFLSNPGSLEDFFIPAIKVLLKEIKKEGRKTKFDLLYVIYKGKLISVDSRLPNLIISEVLKERKLPGFKNYSLIKKEFRYGESQIDFLLTKNGKRCLLEVKSCTLAKNGVALFPDVPTERGRRHLLSLIEAKKNGFRACLIFVIQRTDTKVLQPNWAVDKKFCETLLLAKKKGIEIYAYALKFLKDKIVLGERIPITYTFPTVAPSEKLCLR